MKKLCLVALALFLAISPGHGGELHDVAIPPFFQSPISIVLVIAIFLMLFGRRIKSLFMTRRGARQQCT